MIVMGGEKVWFVYPQVGDVVRVRRLTKDYQPFGTTFAEESNPYIVLDVTPNGIHIKSPFGPIFWLWTIQENWQIDVVCPAAKG